MSKILAMLFMLSLSVLCQVLAMMYGWGLQAKSWWWIIGVGIFLNTVLISISRAIMDE